ncbi:hypothetical protein [Immundisolibacter sp.]
MSALGLGLIAADQYFKAGDARVQREREGQRFDWERQRAESELSTLPDKTEADRSGYQLRNKQNTANIGLSDVQAENAKKKFELEGSGLDAAKERQPLEQAAALNGAEIAKTLSEFQVQDLPRVIAEKKRAGVFGDADSSVAAIGKLAELIKLGDQTQVITFMNAMNETRDPGQRKPPVAIVGIEQDPKTGEKVFVAKDANGQDVMRMSAAQMQRVRDFIGKTEFKTVNAGDSLVQIKGGQATPVYTAPESARSAAAKQGPLERDVGYLVNQHGMTKDQALAHLNSAKTMTREQFILKSVQDSIAMGKKPTSEEVANFGALYDSARQAPTAQPSRQPAAPASNSPAPANLDPQIKSLLGIP